MPRKTKDTNMIENMFNFLQSLPIRLNTNSQVAKNNKILFERKENYEVGSCLFFLLSMSTFLVGFIIGALTWSIPFKTLGVFATVFMLFLGFWAEESKNREKLELLKEEENTLIFSTFSDMKTLTYFFKCLLLFPSITQELNLKNEFEKLHYDIQDKNINESVSRIQKLIPYFYKAYEIDKKSSSLEQVLDKYDLVFPKIPEITSTHSEQIEQGNTEHSSEGALNPEIGSNSIPMNTQDSLLEQQLAAFSEGATQNKDIAQPIFQLNDKTDSVALDSETSNRQRALYLYNK